MILYRRSKTLNLILIFFMMPFLIFGEIENTQDLLPFNDIINLVLNSSPTVKNKILDLKIARIQTAKNWFSVTPQLSLGWNYSYFGDAIYLTDDNNNFILDTQGSQQLIRPSSSSVLSGTITQPLTGLVRSVALSFVNNITQHKFQTELDKSKVEAAFLTAEAYRHAQKTARVYEISKDRLVLVVKQREAAEIKYQLGRLSKSDVLLLDVSVNKAQVEMTKTKAKAQLALAQLLSSLNLPLDHEYCLDKIPSIDEINLDFSILDLTEARKQAWLNNLELKIAQLKIKKHGYLNNIPLLGILPEVNAFFKINHEFEKASLTSIPTNKIFGLTLNWNIWDGGGPIFSLRENQLELSKARNESVIVKRKIDLEVFEKRVDLIATRESFELYKTNLMKTEEAYRAVYERFRLGTVLVTELLEAESTLNSARVDLATALIDLDIKNLQLQKSLGDKRPVTLL